MKKVVRVSIAVLAVFSSCLVQAQKLPKVQEGSVYAPDNIKIDGKLTEWKDQLQAYNPVNLMNYTMSNDDKNLYLTLKMRGGMGGRKVFMGGITFMVKPLLKGAENISITYPAVTRAMQNAAWDSSYGSLWETPSEKRYERLYGDTVANKTELDALITTHNKNIKELATDIQVKGIPGVDELISVYNPEGIKIAGVFNRQMEYTYELSIPLKYLGEAISKESKFSYNIRMNAQATVAEKGTTLRQYPAPKVIMLNGEAPPADPVWDYLYNATDFSGDYTLAKKK